jgi:hypothetical protein
MVAPQSTSKLKNNVRRTAAADGPVRVGVSAGAGA